MLLDNTKFVNRLAYLIGGLAVFIILFSSMIYIVQNWFCVLHVTITGNINHITEMQLSNVAKNNLRGTMFTLDIDELQAEFRQIPWVKSVTVTRSFPDSITVNVTEYDAIAHFGDNGFFIAEDGRVFYGAINDPALPTFYVPEQKIPDIVSLYKAGTDIFKKRDISLNKIYWLGVGITKIEFSNKLQVIICGLDVINKLTVLDKYWDQLYKLNPGLDSVNMCYKNAVAINAITNKPNANKADDE